MEDPLLTWDAQIHGVFPVAGECFDFSSFGSAVRLEMSQELALDRRFPAFQWPISTASALWMFQSSSSVPTPTRGEDFPGPGLAPEYDENASCGPSFLHGLKQGQREQLIRHCQGVACVTIPQLLALLRDFSVSGARFHFGGIVFE
jgi:hypothetical protein